jgi:hypothetical protein
MMKIDEDVEGANERARRAMAAARCARARACNNGCFAERWASVPWACVRAPPPPSSAALRCENIATAEKQRAEEECEVQQPRVPSSLRCAACRPFRRADRLLVAGLAPAAAHRAAARPPPAARDRTRQKGQAWWLQARCTASRARRKPPMAALYALPPDADTRVVRAARAPPRLLPCAAARTFRRRCQP